MNEITYNIIRKMVENPLEVGYDKNLTNNGGDLYIKGKYILTISYCNLLKVYTCYKYDLSSKDIDRILHAVDHCEAMRIRNL